jgi:hypothetical protein
VTHDKLTRSYLRKKVVRAVPPMAHVTCQWSEFFTARLLREQKSEGPPLANQVTVLIVIVAFIYCYRKLGVRQLLLSHPSEDTLVQIGANATE